MYGFVYYYVLYVYVERFNNKCIYYVYESNLWSTPGSFSFVVPTDCEGSIETVVGSHAAGD